MARPVSAEELAVLPQPEKAQVIACADCGHTVTQKQHALSVEGSHERTFRNPAGYSFHVLCFAEAPGCQVQGHPTTEASWFPNTAWTFAFCEACGQHLGWHYIRKAEPAFYGLIAPRLTGWR